MSKYKIIRKSRSFEVESYCVETEHTNLNDTDFSNTITSGHHLKHLIELALYTNFSENQVLKMREKNVKHKCCNLTVF